MAQYMVAFDNFAPDTLEVRPVDTLSTVGLQVPDDAMKFAFYDADQKPIGLMHYVSNDPVIGSLEELKARFPQANEIHSEYGRAFEVTQFGLVTWDHPEGPQWSDSCIIPLVEGFALVDRTSGEVVWTPAESS